MIWVTNTHYQEPADGVVGGLPFIGEDVSYGGNVRGSNTWISSPLQPSREVGGLSGLSHYQIQAMLSSDHCTSAMLGNGVTRRLSMDYPLFNLIMAQEVKHFFHFNMRFLVGQWS